MILYKPFLLNDHFLGRRVIKPVRLLMAILIFILKSPAFKFLLWNSDGNTGFSSNVTTILSLGRRNFLNWKSVTLIGTKKKSYNGLSQNPTMTRLNGFCGKVYSALSGGATEAWREKERALFQNRFPTTTTTGLLVRANALHTHWQPTTSCTSPKYVASYSNGVDNGSISCQICLGEQFSWCKSLCSAADHTMVGAQHMCRKLRDGWAVQDLLIIFA